MSSCIVLACYLLYCKVLVKAFEENAKTSFSLK